MRSKPISKDVLGLLLVGNEHRGNDATGVAISQADGSVHIVKDDDQAWRFITMKKYKDFIEEHLKEDTWAVLLHTRAATKGSPRQNKNNHPMFSGAGAIVHNGCINNDDVLFRNNDMKRGADTDSDIIRAFVDKFGLTEKCIEEMNKISGSAAGSAIHPDFPKKLLLFRSGSPMTLGSTEDFLVWSSEKTTIHRAMRPWVERWNMHFQEQRPEIAFAPFPDDSAWLIGENGLECHAKFKTLGYQYNEPYRRTYEGFKDRNKKWDEEKERLDRIERLADNKHDKKDKWDEGYCSKCNRDWLIPKGSMPHEYHCDKEKKGCGASLTYKPVYQTVN